MRVATTIDARSGGSSEVSVAKTTIPASMSSMSASRTRSTRIFAPLASIVIRSFAREMVFPLTELTMPLTVAPFGRCAEETARVRAEAVAARKRAARRARDLRVIRS
jgi:hypothetical protein